MEIEKSVYTFSTLFDRAKKTHWPLVSVVVAAYNESSILYEHLTVICDYLVSIQSEFDWELIIINDGSKDQTGEIADQFAKERDRVTVYHHPVNRGLGQSLQDGFQLTKGDYVVTLDIDLSCGPEYVLKMVQKLIESDADIVIASPYMKGGQMSNVPFHRKVLSIAANRFLSALAPGHLTSLTCMVRAYKGTFIRSLDLRATGMEIMPEILYKAMIMNGKIEEIPAHLDWSLQIQPESKRKSSMKIVSHTMATIFTGFLLRPFLFIILPGIFLFLFSLYPITWMFIHFFSELENVSGEGALHRASQALAIAYELHPHTFLVGLLSLVLSIQLIASGFLSLQNKQYYEEMYYLITHLRHGNTKKY
ncbi:MAG: hypothetical protein Tsb0021_11460 [Chlamydiales bacterium]